MLASSIFAGQLEHLHLSLSLLIPSLSMTPTYLNSQPFPFPIDFHDDDHQHHELLTSPKSQASSSSSSPSLSCTMFSNPSLDHQGGYHHPGEIQLLGHQHEDDTFVSHVGSYDHLNNESAKYGLKLPIWNKKNNQSEDQNEIDYGSSKWMSSKMRLIGKMANNGANRSGEDVQINTTTPMFGGDHHHKQLLQIDHNINNTIRVCSDCHTTKTPLWRSGPSGPKSLCNACGIRQRKARRAMAAAANGTIPATATTSHVKTKVQNKDKKKCSKKLTAASSSTTSGRSEKLCFEDFTLRLSEKYSAFQRVFPQDEKEAAILLMALSYGLVS